VELLSTFAEQAVIAIENVRRFKALETRTDALTRSLDRQTATSEILRAISRSPTDYVPVFQTILENATHLCGAPFGCLFLLRDDHLHLAANLGGHPDFLDFLNKTPLPLDRPAVASNAARQQVPVQNLDIADELYRAGDPIRVLTVDVGGLRTLLGVPMLKGKETVGVMGLYRQEVKAFSDEDIELVSTFADQAVIAIENVRLFNETKEALERQTAMAEILKVIASSPSSVQPVFDAIAESAVRLCDAVYSAAITLEGGLLHLTAHNNWPDETLAYAQKLFPMPLEADHLSAIAVRENRLIYQDHLQDDPDVPTTSRELARISGYHSLIIVPMVREGRAVGVMVVTGKGAFSDHQVALLKTFTDQAVIAIENVRLFNETKEALERQTATAEILKVIASSPSDVQPVLETIVESAVRLCDAVYSAVITIERGMLHLVAYKNWPAEGLALAQRLFPMPLESDHLSAIAARENRVIHQVNLQDDPEVPASSRELAKITGYRALLIVPMVREDQSQGVIVVARRDAFSNEQIGLLQTFADQAVIAIENVRLFNETKEALERQTATAEILEVISRSQSDLQPVFLRRYAAAYREPRIDDVRRREGHAGNLSDARDPWGCYGPRDSRTHCGSGRRCPPGAGLPGRRNCAHRGLAQRPRGADAACG
jgi:GAF domain-containing protein